MWLVNKPQQQIERVFVRPDVSNYHVESIATRQTRLQSMASIVVDLADWTVSSTQNFLKEFFVQHGNVRVSDMGRAAEVPLILANPSV
jgi:hypothetical protein